MSLAVLISFSMTSFALAENCSSEGERLAEQVVRASVAKQFGNVVKINTFIDSEVGKDYSTDSNCFHETLYTFEALDSSTGNVKAYMGKIVVDNRGNELVAPVIVEAGKL